MGKTLSELDAELDAEMANDILREFTSPVVDKGQWVEISYCVPALYDNNYASGSRRIWTGEIVEWLRGELKFGKPVILTGIKEL